MSIQKIINKWKVNETNAILDDISEDVHYSSGVLFGIELARKEYEKPFNTRMHMDTKPCAECETEKTNYPWPPFCKWCGRALSQ